MGINRLLARLLGSSRYEDRFQSEMLSLIKNNDRIWDIGANVGLYTEIFSRLTGLDGAVFAFEPSAQNRTALSVRVADCPNVSVIPVALGNTVGQVSFHQGEDDSGATSRIIEGSEISGSESQSIEMRTADSCIADGTAAAPNFIKIDVEGFELDVLQGMTTCLSSANLRVVCVEVHFGLLSARGMANAPAEIETLLTTAGFKCHWSDASHIIATRV
jgi:FkbM family methyltransferase